MRAFAVVSLFATLVVAQESVDDRFGHSAHGAAFDEGPRQLATPMPGMSAQVHFPVAGLDADAQRLFDQGICQQHGFWYFEAERSFRTVAATHPDCAMAYLGITMANVENKPRAAQFAAAAVQRSAAVPHEEQLWIDAFAAYYKIDDAVRTELRSGDAERVKKATAALATTNADGKRDEPALVKQLIKDLETIVFEFPDDIEAKAFLALQIWLAYDWGNGVPITSRAAVDALLDQVFAKAPLHPAHHYRVHLWDQDRKERALKSASVLGDTAPGIAHQWHMAGHIYDKQHWHAEAGWQQEASARVDHAQMQRDRVMPFLIHNYGHNQEWLARSLSWTGRGREALEVAKNLAEIPRHPKWNTLDDVDSIASDARSRLVSVCEEHEMWNDALGLAASGHLDRSDSVRGEVARLALLGRAYYRLHRLDDGDAIAAELPALLTKARAERARAVDTAEDEAVKQKKTRGDVDKARDEASKRPTDVVRSVLDLQRELAGERLLATGDAKAAVVEFEAVSDFPKTLLADAYVAAGDSAKAIDLLEKEVKDRPWRAPTLGRLMVAHDAAFEATKKEEHKTRMRDLMMEAVDLGLGVRDGDEPGSPFIARVGVGVSACGLRPWPARETAGFHTEFGKRPELGSLGPHHWQPFAVPPFDLVDQNGVRHTFAAATRPTLVVFWLGMQCPHCVEQLQALDQKAKDFADMGIDVLAIGNLPAGDATFGFPLLHDADLGTFRAWHCFDEFEAMPLHGTFLIDRGQVRWQDAGAVPFVDFAWLRGECRRLLQLPTTDPK